MSRTIRVGARRSPLAVAQAEWVASQLEAAGHPVEVLGVDSLGDKDRRRLTEIGGTGIFATAVRDLLHDGSIDVAVHSLKDLPVAPAPGLVVAAIPQREDVRDVLVGLAVEQWRDGTRVGTGSPRRAVQLEAMAAERGVRIEVVPIRGNVDSRFRLVSVGEVDATVLAAAGLLRLGRLDGVTTEVTEGQDREINGVPVSLMPVGLMLPAAGQGALAVECREDAEDWLLAALADIDHAPTRAAITAERSFLGTLEAGCLAPVGAHAVTAEDRLVLHAVVGPALEPGAESAKLGQLLKVSGDGSATDPASVGRALATEVLPLLDGNGPTAGREDG
ncbi:hydroxymethylbilane synthase [Luteococcus peritonei]|uniref:Hydroxymethylbilane synthase n=1 Tax=Luteococcus peritonei TaxID=88874 RepID=A0ABW4RWE5_9ACTN